MKSSHLFIVRVCVRARIVKTLIQSWLFLLNQIVLITIITKRLGAPEANPEASLMVCTQSRVRHQPILMHSGSHGHVGHQELITERVQLPWSMQCVLLGREWGVEFTTFNIKISPVYNR